MLYRKPADLKFVDLCIYVDNNIQNIVNPGEHPDIENTVYNYLWLVIKALAIKKCMFTNFEDYDAYAFFAANRLFFAIRKNYWNQGKIIKGKEIRPIKSCLNYMKALLYPMKIEYQKETFQEVISEEYTSKKFDAFKFRERLTANVKTSQGVTEYFKTYLDDLLKDVGDIAEDVLKTSPFVPVSADFKKLKISLLLNAINSIKTKHKLDSEIQTLILWKLPKSMSNYMRILLKEFYTKLKEEIISCYTESDITDTVVEQLLSEGGKLIHEEQYQN